MKRLFLLATLAVVTQSSFADEIQIGVPAYGGTGCPPGTASVALSPEGKALSVLFDQYIAEAGGETGRSMDRKTCNIAIPIHVPQGLSVSFYKMDYRGFNQLPEGAYSQFSTDYFFAGARGPSYSKTFNGQLSADYQLTNVVSASATMWSPCGSDVTLRMNTNMLVRTNATKERTFATIDRIDSGGGVVYFLQWRRC